MHPGFSPFSCPRRLSAAFVVACLLTAVPFRTVAARSVSAGGHVYTPRPSLPSVGGPINSNQAERNALSRLSRMSTLPAQGYDIVPPDPPNQILSGPLPGYQIVRLGRAHFNRLCLVGTVGGTKGLMMLDTGAKTTVLNDATYHSLLLNVSAHLPVGLPRAVNFNGTSTPLAEAPNFYIGASNLGAVPVCLVPRSFLLDPGSADKKGRLYDGLLGENILRHYGAMVDCGKLMLYLNIDPAKKVDQSSSLRRNGWTRVPMTDTGNAFTVPCVLNGRSFRLIVDTGAPFTNLDRDLLAAAQIGTHDLPARSSLIGTPSRPASLVDLDRLQIGGYTATGVHMTATQQSLAAFGGAHDRLGGTPIVGLLGGDTLANNGAVVDIGNRALYLKHLAPKVAKSPRH